MFFSVKLLTKCRSLEILKVMTNRNQSGASITWTQVRSGEKQGFTMSAYLLITSAFESATICNPREVFTANSSINFSMNVLNVSSNLSKECILVFLINLLNTGTG